MAEQSLNDRIGGVNALSMMVDPFSDEIVKNPKLNVNPALKEWNGKGQPREPEVHEDALALRSGRWTLQVHRQTDG